MNIKRKRQKLGLTLLEAGAKLSTDPGNLSRIERGKQLPSLPLARRIASVYGMTIDEVLADFPSQEAHTHVPS